MTRRTLSPGLWNDDPDILAAARVWDSPWPEPCSWRQAATSITWTRPSRSASPQPPPPAWTRHQMVPANRPHVYPGRMDRDRDLVEDQLREAMERGEFDDLPGAGQRLRLGEDSPNWWARRKMEELKRQDRLTALVGHLECDRDRIWSLPDESAVRQAVAEFNRRVASLNEQLREDEKILPLDPEAAVVTWRRMSRLRPS